MHSNHEDNQWADDHSHSLGTMCDCLVTTCPPTSSSLGQVPSLLPFSSSCVRSRLVCFKDWSKPGITRSLPQSAPTQGYHKKAALVLYIRSLQYTGRRMSSTCKSSVHAACSFEFLSAGKWGGTFCNGASQRRKLSDGENVSGNRVPFVTVMGSLRKSYKDTRLPERSKIDNGGTF